MQCKLAELDLGSRWIEQLASVLHPSLKHTVHHLTSTEKLYSDPAGIE